MKKLVVDNTPRSAERGVFGLPNRFQKGETCHEEVQELVRE